MILCSLSDLERHRTQHPDLPLVLDFLKRADLRNLPEGRSDLEGGPCFVIHAPQAALRPAPEALLEVHRRHIDVQVILEGTDRFGWAPLASCQALHTPYDPDKDIAFFGDAPLSVFTVPAGHLAVFFPEDAHAPLIGGQGTVQKLVFKLPVA